MRCLPQNATSTVGMMCLLLRWAGLSREKGGLDKPCTRGVALDLLEAMAKQVVIRSDASSFTCRLSTVPEWTCRWPRPSETSVADLTIVFSIPAHGDVAVDVTQIKTVGTGPSRKVHVGKLWNLISQAVAGDGHIGWKALLSFWAGSPLHPMVTQMMLQLSVGLEADFVRQANAPLKSKKAPVVGPLQFRLFRDTDGASDPWVVARRLFTHVQAGKKLTSGHSQIGIATDKSWVHTLPLQASYIALVDNHCIVACPQVALDG